MSYLTLPFLPAIGLNGLIAPGAKMYFYLTGTSTLTPVYADAELTTPLTNPVVANESGRFVDMFIDDQVIYRIRLETTGGALIDEVDPFSSQTSSSFASDPTRAELAARDVQSGLAVLSGADDHGTYFHDSRILVATHQEVGRKSLYIPHDVGANGALEADVDFISVRDIGMSPQNTAAQNVTAWNAWRDEIGDMQVRQLTRPLVIAFDGRSYDLNANLEVRNSYIQVYGNGSRVVGGGFLFTHNNSVNTPEYCGIRDILIKDAPGSALVVRQNVNFLGKDVIVQNAGLQGIDVQGGNQIRLVRPSVSGCLASYGIRGLSTVITDPVGNKQISSLIGVSIESPDVQGNAGGIAIYEAQIASVSGGAVQVNSGAISRGVSIESVLNGSIVGTSFEGNVTDIYVDTVERLFKTNCNTTGTPTSGSFVITGVASTTNIVDGMPISGTGIAANATINSHTVDTITMSLAATSSPGSVALTISGAFPNRGLTIDHITQTAANGLTVADDMPDLTLRGNVWSGSVTLNTAGTTGFMDAANSGISAFTNNSPSLFDDQRNGAGVGAGGTVTQLTSKATAVTLDKRRGQIVLDAANLAATTQVEFRLNNTTIGANDATYLWVKSGGTLGAYDVRQLAQAAGSCDIALRNLTAGALAESVTIGFEVRKATIS